MKVLALNCGSSTLKFRLFEAAAAVHKLAGGLIDRIGSQG